MMQRRASAAFSFLLLAALGSAQERVRNVIYQEKGGVALTMDVFKPAKPNGIGVLFMVSGGWTSSHDWLQASAVQPMLDKGITVFEVVHGSQPKYTITEILPQIQRAVRFVRTNASTFGVNADKLGIYGMSSGGHLSLMTGGNGAAGDPNAKDPVDRASSEVQAVGAFCPPTDFENFGGPGIRSFDLPLLSVFWPAFGVTKDSSKEKLQMLADTLSPIKFVTAKYPPTYLVQGDKDMLVPMQQAQTFDAALGKAGVKHILVIVPGAGHDIALTTSPEAGKMADWFIQTLK